MTNGKEPCTPYGAAEHKGGEGRTVNAEHEGGKGRTLNAEHEGGEGRTLNAENEGGKGRTLNDEHKGGKGRTLNAKHEGGKGRTLNAEHLAKLQRRATHPAQGVDDPLDVFLRQKRILVEHRRRSSCAHHTHNTCST